MADQYFTPQPSAASSPRSVELHLPDVSLELATDAGVFSTRQVDTGTRILLTEAVRPTGRTVLDLGCGYGPIACVAAMRAPDATVWAVDVNERAQELCRQNAAKLGLTNVHVGGPGDPPPDLSFDLIASNPPIRVGKAKLHAMLEQWLPRLSPDGHAELVVQKHLGSDSLARWLTTRGWPTQRLLSRAGYRILKTQGDLTAGTDTNG